MFEKEWVDFMMSVVPTPLAFFEVEKELFLPDGAEFKQAVFGVAPERFNAVDVILTTSELVLMMMDSVMLVTIGYQPIVGLPSIGVDVTA